MTPGYQQMGREIHDDPSNAAAGAAGAAIGGVPAFLSMANDLTPAGWIKRFLSGELQANPLADMKKKAADIGEWGNKVAAGMEKDPAATLASPGFAAGGRAMGQIMFPPGEAITMGSDAVRERYGEIAGDVTDVLGNVVGMGLGGVRVPGTGKVKIPKGSDRVEESAQRAKDAEDKANKEPIEGQFTKVDEGPGDVPRLPPPDGPPAKAPMLQNQTKLEAEAKAKAAENLEKLQQTDPAVVEEAAKKADTAATARGEEGAATEGQRAMQVQDTTRIVEAMDNAKKEQERLIAEAQNERMEVIELKPIAEHPEVPLPAVAEGHTRMYRGGDTGKFSDEVGRERQNREFSTDRSVATSYGEPSYVDVPHAIAEASRIGPNHYVLPREHAGKAVKEVAVVTDKPAYMSKADWSRVEETRVARDEWAKENPVPKHDIERWC